MDLASLFPSNSAAKLRAAKERLLLALAPLGVRLSRFWEERALPWWEQRQPREKRLAVLLGVAMAVALGYLSFYGIIASHSAQKQRLEAKAANLKTAKQLVKELERLRGLGPGSGAAGMAIKPRIEQLASRMGLTGRMQINPLGAQPGDTAVRLEVRLEELSQDELFFFLYALEKEPPPVTVEHIQVAPSIKAADLLKLELRIQGT